MALSRCVFLLALRRRLTIDQFIHAISLPAMLANPCSMTDRTLMFTIALAKNYVIHKSLAIADMASQTVMAKIAILSGRFARRNIHIIINGDHARRIISYTLVVLHLMLFCVVGIVETILFHDWMNRSDLEFKVSFQSLRNHVEDKVHRNTWRA